MLLLLSPLQQPVSIFHLQILTLNFPAGQSSADTDATELDMSLQGVTKLRARGPVSTTHMSIHVIFHVG